MTGILGGGGGMSWGLGKTGEIKAHLPSITNGSGAGTSFSGRGYSLVSANRSARLAGNSPRDVSLMLCVVLLPSIVRSVELTVLTIRQLPPSAMYKPSQMDPRDFQQTGPPYRYKAPEQITGYVAQYIS